MNQWRRSYGDVGHGRFHSLQHALETLLADHQLSVLQVQRVENGVQAHLGVRERERAHLRRSQVEFEEALLQMGAVDGETGSFLSGDEGEKRSEPEEGVVLGEVDGLRVRLEAHSAKDVIGVGQEILALSLEVKGRSGEHVVNARNTQEQHGRETEG